MVLPNGASCFYAFGCVKASKGQLLRVLVLTSEIGGVGGGG